MGALSLVLVFPIQICSIILPIRVVVRQMIWAHSSEVEDLTFLSRAGGRSSRWVRCAVRLQQTIHEQNLSKPEGLGNSAPLRFGQRICYGEEYEPTSDASVEYGANQIGIVRLAGHAFWVCLVKSWSWLMILRPGRPVWPQPLELTCERQRPEFTRGIVGSCRK